MAFGLVGCDGTPTIGDCAAMFRQEVETVIP